MGAQSNVSGTESRSASAGKFGSSPPPQLASTPQTIKEKNDVSPCRIAVGTHPSMVVPYFLAIE
jgi:hypothetical protein